MTGSTSTLSVARRTVAMITAVVLLTLGMVVTSGMAQAKADTAPTAPALPATVSADPLPTVQVNGVVWSEATVGNIVYATGSFTTARPAGVAAGGAGQVPVGNLIAFDITTGKMVTSFNHTLNAQGMVVRATPDGSKIVVGGDFTTVDGQAHAHLAVFDTATGALDSSFNASTNGQVRALAVTNSAIYLGGTFSQADGSAKSRLAEVSLANGSLLPWNPSASDAVWSLVMTPDQSKVVVGGQFHQLNGQNAYGMGAVDPSTGASLPWAANQTIHDDTNGAIMSLATDGSQIYGSGFAFGAGATFEGEFALDPSTGAINWLNDCQGDTYDVLPVGQVLYTVSHAHNCQMIGAFPQSNPWSINMRHALAFTTYPTGKNQGPDEYGWNYAGIPDSTLLQWFPEFKIGTYTGQSQAAWSLTGNSDYVVAGGEFPSINGVAQQGLVRFAVRSIAPNKVGPRKAPGAPTPSARSVSAGTARVSWQAAYDEDDASLSYSVYRSGTAAPVYTTTQDSNYWTYPMMGFKDTGLTPGSSYTYTVKVSDPWGNTLTIGRSDPVTISSQSASPYAQDVVNDGATAFWRLGESSGPAVYDSAGFNDATAQAGVTRGATGPIAGDPTTASTFDGASDGLAVSNSTMATTPSFTIETWIKTTTTSGGKIVGYGDAQTGTSANYDRHLYMDNAGHLIFGVYPGSAQTVTSSGTYNDGTWHYVVATLDSTAGMTLYVDGKKVGTNAGATSAQGYSGYWRIGGDSLNGWPNQPSSNYFAGTIGDVAIYPSALSLGQVQQHYLAAGGTLDLPPKPTDAYGKAVYNSNPDLYWRLDEKQGPTAFDTSPNQENGVYSGGVTYGVPGALGSQGTAVTFDGVSGGIGSVDQFNDPTVYSEELWFNTTTSAGGKLIGFGNQQSGLSTNYDRQVYMNGAGQLNFGVWTGTQNVITSPDSYNDGKWHYLVATQGPDGMSLYVDGELVASGPQTQAQDYSGYWRVGGDTSWSGNPYFAGTIDEVAVYSHELTASDVQAHYAAGGGTLPNQPPVAGFTDTVSGATASFTNTSSDPDGDTLSYAWDFGDGSTSTQANPSHTYASSGTYTVKLTATDPGGLSDTATESVQVTVPPVNQPPVAAFTDTVSGLVTSFDASGSSDPDGTISSYSWDFGDGSASGTGVNPDHTYASAGTYTVKLKVTDNNGASDSVSHDVTVTAPAATVIASDGFGRTVANGWGTADQGGPWQNVGAGQSVQNGQGLMVMSSAAQSKSAYLNQVSSTDADVHVALTLDKAQTGGGTYISVIGRRVVGAGDYRAKVQVRADGTVWISISRFVGASEVATVAPIQVAGLTYQPGTALNIRFEAMGTAPTTLRAMVWAGGTPEPTAWQVTASDSTASLQMPGGIGLSTYLSGSSTSAPLTASYSDLEVYDASTEDAAQVAQLHHVAATMKLTRVTKTNFRQLHALTKWGKE